MTPALSFSHVGKVYRGTRGELRALNDVNFTIEQEITRNLDALLAQPG